MNKKQGFFILIPSGLFLVMFGLIVFESCQHESEIIDDFAEICFDTQILPIFQNSCGLSDCHDPASAEEGYIYTSYDEILKSVKPGDAESSKAYSSLINFRSDDLMPPDTPLSLENRTLIRIWIEQGAKNTICTDTSIITDPEDTASWVNPRACFSRDILPIMQSSCAFSGCHDASSAAGEKILSDYVNTRLTVKPGDPVESNLYQKLIEDDPDDIMPPAPYSPLPQSQIDSIYYWILYGALDEYCGLSCDTSAVMSFAVDILPIIELSCKSCHSGSNPSGNILLRNYPDVSIIASDGSLTGVLEGVGYSLMPPGSGLDDCSKSKILKWVENGFQNN